ncbi:MAG: AbrB/MazE/SpoVT family DNA-binding domain-containing protein [Elusimicrobia bacterium]|nr:AbrB/MazE/SpoVT family DNA-binding domain-containing protein [Elusimicrobiota bacterium]
MNATVQKWGNSLALRIPRSLAEDVDIHQGSVVELDVVKGEMVVKPKKEIKLSLRQLVKRITKKNLHSETQWGRPMGKEVW